MSKHHVEDVSDDVRIRVAYIASGPPQHAKEDALPKLYAPFEANIVENQQRRQKAEAMAMHAALAGAVMNHSEGQWNIEWRVP